MATDGRDLFTRLARPPGRVSEGSSELHHDGTLKQTTNTVPKLPSRPRRPRQTHKGAVTWGNFGTTRQGHLIKFTWLKRLSNVNNCILEQFPKSDKNDAWPQRVSNPQLMLEIRLSEARPQIPSRTAVTITRQRGTTALTSQMAVPLKPWACPQLQGGHASAQPRPLTPGPWDWLQALNSTVLHDFWA